MNLNREQEKIVKHQNGPLLVIAGAGTGKTRVITERIKYLIGNNLSKADEILALTFTQKAAEEMQNRLSDTMPLGYEEPWVCTFHRFSDRLLQQSGMEIGLNPSYNILPYPEQYMLIRENLFDFKLDYFRPLGNPTKFIGAMLKFFSRLQDECVTAKEFSSWTSSLPSLPSETDLSETVRYRELSSAYEKYSQLKLAASALDFGDLILWTIELFKKRPNILEQYQKQFKYILLDEFQDTNFAQFELIKLLCPASKNPNLIAVGDDDQAVYRFRGAALSNILEFRKVYPKAETVVLAQNYRSTQAILDAAYNLIQNNNPDRLEIKEKVNKRLTSNVEIKHQEKTVIPDGAVGDNPGSINSLNMDSRLRGNDKHKQIRQAVKEPEILEFSTGEAEAEGVVTKIIQLISQEPMANGQKPSFKNFAILARANSQLDPFVQALRFAQIPYQLIGNRGLFDQEEIKNLIAIFKWLADPSESLALYQILKGGFFKVEAEKIQKSVQNARRKKTTLWEIVQKELAFETIEYLKKTLEKTDTLRPSRLLYEIIQQTGYIQKLVKKESIENQLKIKNINLFFDKIKQYEKKQENPTVYGFVDWLEILKEAGDNPAQAEIEDIDTVNLLTIHSAKGLEFDYVFVVNMVAGRFPSISRADAIDLPKDLIKETLPEGDYHLQEERRLFYVACTRAKKELYLTYAKDYGGARARQASGFLNEISDSRSQASDFKNTSQKSTINKQPFENLAIKSEKTGTQLTAITNINHLSYSQLETFWQCPLKYRYKYILGIPTLPSHALNFGQVIHRSLRDFHTIDLFNDQSQEKLLNVYKEHFLQNDEGYIDLHHKQMRFEHGEVILKKYFKEHKSKLAEPIALEKKFTIKISNIPLTGSIDRIDKLPDGSYEVIDYKTGSDKKMEKVGSDAQLSIYALACREVPGILHDKSTGELPKSLALYFVETGEKVTTKRTDKQLEKIKEKIENAIEEIKTSDFPAKPSPLCRYCEFKDICPYSKEAL